MADDKPKPKAARKPSASPQKRAARRRRVSAVLPLLYHAHPDARCSLDFQTPLQLLVATILSAQCTDVLVNKVTPKLFARYPDASAYAGASQEELESYVARTGFFRNKAKSIRSMAADLVEKHGGDVPRTMAELTSLAGVGRKTANVVLGNAFGTNVGVTVDTHVTRLANRLGWTEHETDAVKIEKDLIDVVPQDQWTMISHLLIHHGRRVCRAQRPACEKCVLLEHCPTGPKVLKERAKTAKAAKAAKSVKAKKPPAATRG